MYKFREEPCARCATEVLPLSKLKRPIGDYKKKSFSFTCEECGRNIVRFRVTKDLNPATYRTPEKDVILQYFFRPPRKEKV